MHMLQNTLHLHPDEDLLRMARPGLGVPSQDPRPEAQVPLSLQESARELQSIFSGGGVLAGIALGATFGMWTSGPAGVLLGSLAGAVIGITAGVMLGRSLKDAP